jgi:RNA polymerase sigma factor (sigma-70 family)
MSEPHSDILLWKRFKEGDRPAFAALYDRYIQELLTYGYRVTSDRQLIRDAIQDLFLHLWTSRENLADTDSVRYYLFRCLRNSLVKSVRQEQMQSSLPEACFHLPAPETDETDADQIRRLQAAIQQLSPREQEVIQLRYVHNFSIQEVADMLGITNQSVRNTQYRALGHLREAFDYWIWVTVLLTGSSL